MHRAWGVGSEMGVLIPGIFTRIPSYHYPVPNSDEFPFLGAVKSRIPHHFVGNTYTLPDPWGWADSYLR